jgi:hypothetical protein
VLYLPSRFLLPRLCVSSSPFCCLASFSDYGGGATRAGVGGAPRAGGRDAPGDCGADASARCPLPLRGQVTLLSPLVFYLRGMLR